MADVRAIAQAALGMAHQFQRKYPNNAVPIISIQHSVLSSHQAGVVVEALPKAAGYAIARGTHREASKEEHDNFKLERVERTKALRQQEYERKAAAGQIAVMQQEAACKPERVKEIK